MRPLTVMKADEDDRSGRITLTLKMKIRLIRPLLGSLSDICADTGNWKIVKTSVRRPRLTSCYGNALPKMPLKAQTFSFQKGMELQTTNQIRSHHLCPALCCERFLKRPKISTISAGYSPILSHTCAFVKNSPEKSRYIMKKTFKSAQLSLFWLVIVIV